jgi:ribonuclease J
MEDQSMAKKVVIASACRTAIGTMGGTLSTTPAATLGSIVIKDRKLMSRDGILITILNINPLTRKLLIKPNITTRGFILVNENAELIAQIENKTTEIVEGFLKKNAYSYTDLKNTIILELHPFISQLTGRRPIVLPVIMEIRETPKN